MGPYDGMFKVFGVPIKAQPGGYDALAVLKGWAFLMPEMLDDRAIESMRKFERVNALGLCEQTIEVTDYNLSRLQAALAHEAHHNISGMNWDPVNITVGRYIIIEGLAESFATALYGENCVGPWVADFDMENMPRIKAKEKYDYLISSAIIVQQDT